MYIYFFPHNATCIVGAVASIFQQLLLQLNEAMNEAILQVTKCRGKKRIW